MTMTRTQLEALSTEDLLDGFSDGYKDLNGFRPRYTPSREELISFWSTFQDDLNEEEARMAEYDAQRWAAATIEFGTPVTDWKSWEKAYHAHHAAEMEAYYAAEAAKEAAHTARFTKMNPVNTVEAWEEGLI